MRRRNRGGRPPGNQRPAYLEFADTLRAQITKSGSPTRMPSIRELAARHRIGVGTVRAAVQVLRREGHLGLNLRRRLVAVWHAAPVPVLSSAAVLLEVLSAPLHRCWQNPEFMDLQSGVECQAGKESWPLTVVHSFGYRESLPYGFLEQGVRGVILSGNFSRQVLSEYERLPIPVVLADEPAGGHQIHCVAVDNIAAAREAAERLLQAGHRRIAFLRYVSMTQQDVSPDSQERQAGFLAAFKARGLRARPEDVVNILMNATAENPAFRRLASGAAGYTAALCASARMAEQLAQAAHRAGRSVPQDLAIHCFQGLRSSAPFPGPAIDFHAIGREAVRLASQPRRPAIVRRIACTERK